jgi:hypothetical protein
MLHSRTFDGTSFGPDVTIDPYHDPYWTGVPTGVGSTTFTGMFPSFYSQISNVTGMFYSAGRLYYTLAGQSGLYSRWFSPDSGIVDETKFTASSSVDFSDADGMFVSGDTLYFVKRSDGGLYRVSFANDAVTGSATLVSGPGIDGVDWKNRALFFDAGPAAPPVNQAPMAAFTSSCEQNVCAFDGSGSSDPEGSTLTYSWEFGDGSSATGVKPSHAYASGDSYQVTLTVTDGDQATGVVTHSVVVSDPPAGAVGFVAASHSSDGAARFKAVDVPSQAQPGDTVLLFFTQADGVGWTAPSGGGWTEVDSFANATVRSTVWTKTVAAGDPGSTVRLDTDPTKFSKATLSLAVYSNVDVSTLVAAHSGDSNTSSHLSPTVSASLGQVVLTYWADKSAGTTLWTAPAGVAVRDTAVGSGAGRYGFLLGDSGGPVAGGAYGGLTATTDDTSQKAVSWTIALTPSA